MRTAWIIDGAYLFNYGQITGKMIDIAFLRAELERVVDCQIDAVHYYNGVNDALPDEACKFYDWLRIAREDGGAGIKVHLYALKHRAQRCPHCHSAFSKPIQKGVDVGIAVKLVELAARNHYDRIILTTGDGDFADAIKCAQVVFGKTVVLNVFKRSISAELSHLVDNQIFLEDLNIEKSKND